MKILLKLKTNLHFFLIFTLKLVSWEYKFNLTKFNTFSFKYMKKTLMLFIFSQPSWTLNRKIQHDNFHHLLGESYGSWMLKAEQSVSSSSSPHQLLPPLNSTEDGSLDGDPQNLFCPSVLLFLEQLSKVARGSSCKHTNLPLKSRPWGNSGTLLINSESHQLGARLPFVEVWDCTSRHTSASKPGCWVHWYAYIHFIGK